MSQENVELVRRVVESNRSDYREADLEPWDPNCEYTSLLGAVEPQTYRGHDGIRRYISDMADAWEDWRNEIDEVFEAGPDTVVTTFRTRVIGKDSGAAVEERLAAVFVLSGGKVLRGRTYPSRADALEAVGLRE
jgi:ketosteroid isomerase-like protein